MNTFISIAAVICAAFCIPGIGYLCHLLVRSLRVSVDGLAADELAKEEKEYSGVTFAKPVYAIMHCVLLFGNLIVGVRMLPSSPVTGTAFLIIAVMSVASLLTNLVSLLRLDAIARRQLKLK